MAFRSAAAAGTLAVSVLGTVALSHLAATRYKEPFPSLSVSLSSPVSTLSDFVGITMGFRKLTADLAWIQILLYYGTNDPNADFEEVEQGGGHYPLFMAYCERVAQIDPDFKHVFYYGGGVLGWNLNRLDEAEKLLEEGIQAHPKEWRFQQFLAGLAFQKDHNINKLVEFLEGFVQEPDCPNLLRSILANIYKRQKRYIAAIHIWTLVYETGDPMYSARSIAQMKEIAPLAHAEREMGNKAH